ncbi:MAG TPA: GyrI-like domain-containing protein [Solirubrobacteraceae bacterium]|nr:GyrI-like domain-containing protein [Solirubrobacteraceae bacterium]
MSEQPRIEHKEEQPYVGIRTSVSMQELAGAAERHFAELFDWLQAQGITASGAPFTRYLRIDMDHELEIELAVPVPSAVPSDDHRHAGVLPPGRYVTLRHVGPYDGLVSANARIQAWARENGIRWQMTDESLWGARVERYLTDPSREPDPSRWETELAYLAIDE